MRKFKILVVLILFILFPLSLVSSLDNYFSERTEEYMEQVVTFAASDIFSDAALEVSNFANNDSFLKYKYDNENKIIGVYVDTIVANQILANISNLISTSLTNGVIEKRLGEVPIPLGQFLSRSLFASYGPEIIIRTSPMYSYTTDIYTETKEYGINNTLLEVYIYATINIEAFIPLKSQNITITSKIYLISEVLQGNIPVYYFSGNL